MSSHNIYCKSKLILVAQIDIKHFMNYRKRHIFIFTTTMTICLIKIKLIIWILSSIKISNFETVFEPHSEQPDIHSRTWLCYTDVHMKDWEHAHGHWTEPTPSHELSGSCRWPSIFSIVHIIFLCFYPPQSLSRQFGTYF